MDMLYWSDGKTDKIQRAPIPLPQEVVDPGLIEDVVVLPVGAGPGFFALDLCNREIYFPHEAKLWRAQLDAIGMEQEICAGIITAEHDVDLDVSAGVMYWSSGTTTIGKIQRAPLDIDPTCDSGDIEDVVCFTAQSTTLNMDLDVNDRNIWISESLTGIAEASMDPPGGICQAPKILLSLQSNIGITIDSAIDYTRDVNGNGFPDECEPCNTDTECDDGLFCTGTESCVSGQCQPGTDPCINGPECADHCNEATDDCFNLLGTACGSPVDDECTDPDACDGAGVCLDNHAPPDTACGDPTDDDCTDPDTCDCVGTCQDNHEPPDTPCNDGLFCTVSDECDGTGACVGMGDPCAPRPECADLCNEQANRCDDDPFGTACSDDGEPCTNDQCDGVGTCVHPPLDDGTPCLDSLFCNGEETCQDGLCQPGSEPCTDPALPLCHENRNECVECLEDTDCDDDNLCTDDRCDADVWECKYEEDAFCPPGQSCCPDDGLCHECCDNAQCTPPKICISRECCDPTIENCDEPCPVDGICNDDNPCTDDKCVDEICVYNVVDDGTPCPDETYCNGEEVCVGGECVAGDDPCSPNRCCEDLDVCADECCDDEDCPPDRPICNPDGICVPDCVTNDDCIDEDPCTFDRCIPPCTHEDARLGDVCGVGGSCGPDGEVSLFDILCILDGFEGNLGPHPPCTRLNFDIVGSQGSCIVNAIVDLSDILAVLDAFEGRDRCCAGGR